jgi:hypothetical protein
VVATEEGICLVDRDQIAAITDRAVTCALDEQAATLPKPDGAPIYDVNVMNMDSGHDIHDVLGRLFRRGKWHLEKLDEKG